MEIAAVEVLNRAGILLNVISGVLLTPSIIGQSRLRQLEQWTEEVMERHKNVAGQRLRHYEEERSGRAVEVDDEDYEGDPYYNPIFAEAGASMREWVARIYVASLTTFPAALLLWSLVTLGIFKYFVETLNLWQAVLVTGVVTFASLTAVALPLLVLTAGNRSDWFCHVAVTIALAGTWPLFISMLRHSWTYLNAKLVHRASSFLSSVLQGEDRVVAVMTVLGMFAFVIGNALQFWATFVPA